MTEMPEFHSDAAQSTRHKTEATTDLRALAQFIADGEIPFPMDRQAQERRRLANLVRERRRRRLVEYLAQQIARSILSDGKRVPKEDMQCLEINSIPTAGIKS
jgi:hypothetical protein